jgi:hypothetical protein
MVVVNTRPAQPESKVIAEAEELLEHLKQYGKDFDGVSPKILGAFGKIKALCRSQAEKIERLELIHQFISKDMLKLHAEESKPKSGDYGIDSIGAFVIYRYGINSNRFFDLQGNLSRGEVTVHGNLVTNLKAKLAGKTQFCEQCEVTGKKLADSQAQIDRFWEAVYHGYLIETREEIEKECKESWAEGTSPLEVAAHYMWKREPKVEELQAQIKSFDETHKANDLILKQTEARCAGLVAAIEKVRDRYKTVPDSFTFKHCTQALADQGEVTDDN